MMKVITMWKFVLFLTLLSAQVFALKEKVLKINTALTAGVVGDVIVTGANENEHFPDAKHANFVERAEKSNTNFTDPTHICTREETYVEQLKVPLIQPVRIRSSNWCLEFPPRCSNYRTEMREVVKVKNITKTRTIRFCCEGYEGNISVNDTICKPVCRGGCGRGFCRTPDICSCEAGYSGKHCTERCDHDHWGIECKNVCQCQNGAVCDNKSGICHCTTGWAGDFCELPCPAGTYGVMCRKTCDCGTQLRCHPQTGACEKENVAPNATHAMMATLNSTIANITHNLDRIAKNIVNIAPSTAATDIVELSTAKSVPEVILIKQDDHHTPKIIVHQQGAGLLENLHTIGDSKTPEVIHVITGWPTNGTHDGQVHLAGFGAGSQPAEDVPPATATKTTTAVDHDANLLTTLLIILLIIMIAIAVSFLYVYRRYHWQKERVETALAARNPSSSTNETVGLGGGEAGTLGKSSFLKPLPDLPAFTQMVRNKIEAPEFYDSPSNNSSIKTPPYAYARKESLYSVVPPKTRRGSPDSHLYDEIRYPTAMQHHHHHHQQQQQQHQEHLRQQQQLQYSQLSAYVPHQPASHHVTHLIIPPQNSKFLQVPQMLHSSHKIAHM